MNKFSWKTVIVLVATYEVIAYFYNQHSLHTATGSGFLLPVDLIGKFTGNNPVA